MAYSVYTPHKHIGVQTDFAKMVEAYRGIKLIKTTNFVTLTKGSKS